MDIESFPDIDLATEEGVLAIGGDLSPERLELAYRSGIFPWYDPDEVIVWWSPDPRCVFFPKQFKPSKNLLKRIKQADFRFSFDRDFIGVMKGCREGRPDTWIGAEVMSGYYRLFERGMAHSCEVWQGDALVGGLYGVDIGRVFFGESMFFRTTDASKAALAFLVSALLRHDYALIDCQVSSPHILSLGAVDISRKQFRQILTQSIDLPGKRDWNQTLLSYGD